MSKPDIVIVPGFWEGPGPFIPVASILTTNGYTAHIAPLASTGHVNPSSNTSTSTNTSANTDKEAEEAPYTLAKDTLAIRAVVEPLVARGVEVVMVLHSAGGFLGAGAIEGLTGTARREMGLKGGVVRILFVAAGVAPVGAAHGDGLPFFDVRGDRMWCASPRELLFNEITDDAEAQEHVQRLENQPAHGWAGVVEYAGWTEVPSVYLVCEGDAIIPKEMQMQFAQIAGSEVVTCDAGHMPQVTRPDFVARIVMEAALKM